MTPFERIEITISGTFTVFTWRSPSSEEAFSRANAVHSIPLPEGWQWGTSRIQPSSYDDVGTVFSTTVWAHRFDDDASVPRILDADLIAEIQRKALN